MQCVCEGYKGRRGGGLGVVVRGGTCMCTWMPMPAVVCMYISVMVVVVASHMSITMCGPFLACTVLGVMPHRACSLISEISL